MKFMCSYENWNGKWNEISNFWPKGFIQATFENKREKKISYWKIDEAHGKGIFSLSLFSNWLFDFLPILTQHFDVKIFLKRKKSHNFLYSEFSNQSFHRERRNMCFCMRVKNYWQLKSIIAPFRFSIPITSILIESSFVWKKKQSKLLIMLINARNQSRAGTWYSHY